MLDWLFCLAHPWLVFCQSTPLFFFDSIAEWILGNLHWGTLWLGLNGCVFCCSQNDSHGFVLYPVELQQSRLWEGCKTQTIVNDAMAPSFRSHGFQCGQSILVPEFCWFDLRLVCQHSVEVDPEVPGTVRAFYDFSIEGDCWYCLSYCFVVKAAPQGLRLAWIDFGLSLSWYQCDIFSSCSWTTVTAVLMSLAVL